MTMLPIFLNCSLGDALVMSSTDTVTSNDASIKQVKCFAIQLVWTGTPVGNFKLQASCDPYDGTPTNWSDIANTTVAAGGGSGSHIYNITDAGYNWIQVSYTNASGSGTFSVRINEKGV